MLLLATIKVPVHVYDSSHTHSWPVMDNGHLLTEKALQGVTTGMEAL